MTIDKLIETNEIRIVSGEGEVGGIEQYHGKRTLRAIKMRLKRERCGGQRWARAEVFSHSAVLDADASLDVFVNVETGEYI